MNLHDDPLGYWPFESDLQDHSPSKFRSSASNVVIGSIAGERARAAGAAFDGKRSVIQVADHHSLRLGNRPFSISLWLHTDAGEGDVIGDLVSCYDPDKRTGFTLSVASLNGVTGSPLVNDRHLHFGIDDGRPNGGWLDCGRPGEAVKIAALHVDEGNLFAGTFEFEADQTGHLWRYDEDDRWQDLGGCPDGSSNVPAITHFDGDLYCSTGRYQTEGSFLGPRRNMRPGGHVYRVCADGQWVDCGLVGADGARPDDTPEDTHYTDKADETTMLVPFRGELLAVSAHRRGVWRYEGDTSWKRIGPDERLISFTVFQGQLYGTINGGPVMRYDGDDQWADCGRPATSTQTYGAAIYQNELYVGTWPEAEVYRYDGDREWHPLPRLGLEREVMCLVVYNGKLYAGALPMGHAYRLDGDDFTFVGNLDDSEAVLRRVWTMAVYRGRLFGGTLPSGRVRSLQAGVMATTDRSLASGWRHIAAVRHSRKLELFVDGGLVASSPCDDDFDLSCDRPLRLGRGQHAALSGALSDLRLYARALTVQEIAELATRR